MRNLIVLPLVLLASSAWAVNREALSDALRSAKEARQRNERESPCHAKVNDRLDDLIDALKVLKEEPEADGIRRARKKAAKVKDALDDCPEKLAHTLGKLMDRTMEKLKGDDDDHAAGDEDGDHDHKRDHDHADHQRDHDDGDHPRDHDADSAPPPPVAAPAPMAPMDQQAFSGLMQALQGNPNEITRKEIALQAVRTNWMTAIQVGRVLDLFMNEILKLEVAKASVPHIVDRPNAYRLAARFHNTIMQAEFTSALSAP